MLLLWRQACGIHGIGLASRFSAGPKPRPRVPNASDSSTMPPRKRLVRDDYVRFRRFLCGRRARSRAGWRTDEVCAAGHNPKWLARR